MDVFIVDAVRTPVGKAGEKGVFKELRADELGVVAVRALLERTGIVGAEVEDVIMGCAQQWGQQALNIARNIVLLAGLPVEVAATTVDRQCGSSLQAVNFGALAINSGVADVIITGGIESMTHNKMYSNAELHPRLFEICDQTAFHMGLTAENLAVKYGITRRQMDEFALASHRKAVAAQKSGRFDAEIVPVITPSGREVTADQGPRPETSMELLSALKPAFKPEGGTVTAGNASCINDGAAAVLLMSEAKVKEKGIKPMARVVTHAVAGVSPEIMGIGPVPATKKALRRANLSLDDIEVIEINEAFAVQVLSCQKELGFDLEKTNPNGGAIALGHPLGCSGARILTTLVHEMRRRKSRYGLATLCIGFGQGIATIVEGV